MNVLVGPQVDMRVACPEVSLYPPSKTVVLPRAGGTFHLRISFPCVPVAGRGFYTWKMRRDDNFTWWWFLNRLGTRVSHTEGRGDGVATIKATPAPQGNHAPRVGHVELRVEYRGRPLTSRPLVYVFRQQT